MIFSHTAANMLHFSCHKVFRVDNETTIAIYTWSDYFVMHISINRPNSIRRSVGMFDDKRIVSSAIKYRLYVNNAPVIRLKTTIKHHAKYEQTEKSNHTLNTSTTKMPFRNYVEKLNLQEIEHYIVCQT